jgi:DNA primase
VAGLGTAFTPSHAEALRRHASSVVLVYDGDAAGRRAAARAAEILLAAELEARVALVPAGHAPCDLLVAEGAEALQAVLDGSREALDHLVDESIREHGTAGGAGTAAAVDGLVRIALSVPNRVRRVVLLRRISLGLGVPEDAVNHRARALGGAASAPETATASVRPVRSAAELGPARERMLVESALVGEGLAARLAEEIPTASFESPDLALIAEAVVATASAEGTARPAACAARLAGTEREDLAERVTDLASRGSGRDAASVLRQFDDCVAGLSMDRRIEEARRAFSAARASGDVEGESRWLADFQRLQTERMRATRPAKG